MVRAGSHGPLAGIKIIELAGIGPGPMCAMLLADLGATVLRIDRPQPGDPGIECPLRFNLTLRSRHSISLDLKTPEAVEVILRLVEQADSLIEGFRPGVTERLGLGPEICLARNERLVYGRITGWGQTGPLASRAGHDINYLSITGILNAIGRSGMAPSIPLNLLGDYAGGSLYLAFGIMAAIYAVQRTGRGQVVDAAIVDGAAHLATSFFGMVAAGLWNEERGTNIIDGGAFFYDFYQCSDNRWISIGPIEQKFLAELLRLMEIDSKIIEQHSDRSAWPLARELLTKAFRVRSRSEWIERLQNSDACFTPVLSWDEALKDSHLRARKTFIEVEGILQPAAAPRFSLTPPPPPTPPTATDEDIYIALKPWFSNDEIAALRSKNIIK